ncbi:MAG: hypothetical protein GY874_15215 [Desulfobacteraceae bacterium]|nr:hypothetical protein [Desulfobacteraceae bacterium]
MNNAIVSKLVTPSSIQRALPVTQVLPKVMSRLIHLHPNNSPQRPKAMVFISPENENEMLLLNTKHIQNLRLSTTRKITDPFPYGILVQNAPSCKINALANGANNTGTLPRITETELLNIAKKLNVTSIGEIRNASDFELLAKKIDSVQLNKITANSKDEYVKELKNILDKGNYAIVFFDVGTGSGNERMGHPAKLNGKHEHAAIVSPYSNNTGDKVWAGQWGISLRIDVNKLADSSLQLPKTHPSEKFIKDSSRWRQIDIDNEDMDVIGRPLPRFGATKVVPEGNKGDGFHGLIYEMIVPQKPDTENSNS